MRNVPGLADALVRLFFFPLIFRRELLDSFLRRYVSPKPCRPSLFASGSHPNVFPINLLQQKYPTSGWSHFCKAPAPFQSGTEREPVFIPFLGSSLFRRDVSGTSNKGWFCKSLPLYNKTHGLGP